MSIYIFHFNGGVSRGVHSIFPIHICDMLVQCIHAKKEPNLELSRGNPKPIGKPSLGIL